MRSVVLWFLLAVASTTTVAWADPAATDRVQTQATAAERKVAELATQQKTLSQRYESELQTIDRLKLQRPSWRRDRELRDDLASSQETANQLTAATRELTTARATVATARQALVTAIDAELAGGAPAARAQQLARLRDQLAPQVARTAHKIVIPDEKIDPKADPEELDEQAAALRESESQLATQVAGLDAQGKELDHVALLRKQHERAGELGTRDDDQSHRNASHGSGSTTTQGDGAAAPTGAGLTGGGAGDRAPTPAGFESEASIVLANVVDAPTIDGLARAQRSGDPQQRAAAVKKTRDVVAARLEQLRKQRAQIETRAQSLRGKR